MAVTHELKTHPPYFEAVERGEKTFEVRRDDRGFQKGDRLILRWFDPGRNPTMQGANGLRTIEKTISYVLTGGQFGIEPGYVILGLATPSDKEGGDSVGRKIGRPKARPLVKPCGKENLIYPSAAQAVLRAKQGEG